MKYSLVHLQDCFDSYFICCALLIPVKVGIELCKCARELSCDHVSKDSKDIKTITNGTNLNSDVKNFK